MYGQGHLWVVVTIAAAIILNWFVFGNLIKKKKRSSPTPIVNNNPAASTSASASAATLVGEYEVFLSFRGTDTRDGFTDYLYNDLVSAGICTFRDDNELRVGEEIGPELLRAIKQSKISIPIFSQNYASSKWCLREFAQMMECRKNGKQIIYPIFYDVEPSEVQHYERGSYKAAFLQHDKDKKLDEKTVQQWKTALEIVGDLKGFELQKITNGRQGELVKIVVEEVLSKLKKNNKHVPENLVGMDGHIKEMERLINIDFVGVRIIGILGMGGLGKTTIAKVVYNQVCELFECHCFIEDVRENSNSNAIVKLQQRLVSQILKRESKIDDVHHGIDKIKGAIHRKKVLIVLDDVNKKFQIDHLVGNHSWYEAGSRIIITTRDEDVLLALERTCQNEALHELYKCYKPKFMDDNLALELFSKYAFMADSPPKDYEALAMEVVSYAGGLPLVLVTLGALLFIEKDRVSWQDKLRKLRALPPEEVLERLKISYDALDNAQKQIFLDIGCLFSGLDKTNPCYMWDDCNYYSSEGIDALVRRSLITVRNGNRLWMHDRLRELAEQIICENCCDEPGKWSRLWRFEDAWNILNTHLGTENVKLLRLDRLFDRGRLRGEDFRKLPNLRYLMMEKIDLDGDFKNLLQNLRWLQWNDFSEISASTNFHMKNLVVLDLSHSYTTDDWGAWSQIKGTENVKLLRLNRRYDPCYDRRYDRGRLRGEDFRKLPNLRYLSMMDYIDLDGDFKNLLQNLRWLQWRYCPGNCAPTNLHMKNLLVLDISFSTITDDWGGWSQIKMSKRLKVLDISYCLNLTRIPHLSALPTLERLQLKGCTSLCRLDGLEELESLKYLDASGCFSLESLPDLSKLTSLQTLDMSNKLKVLNLPCCKNITRIPHLSAFPTLERLELEVCKLLCRLDGLEELESLKYLNASCCYDLESLPDLSKLTSLQTLDVNSCKKLTEIQGLDKLASLEFLDTSWCRALERLPNLSNLQKLTRFKFSYCEKLVEIQGLDILASLEHLDIQGCKSLKSLPDLSNLTNLKELNVSHCVKLTELRGLEELKFLKELGVVGCDSLENLPNLPNTRIQKYYNHKVESSH